MPTVFPLSPSNGDTYIRPQIQKLLASDPASTDYFGYSVSISSDGNTALIGAYLENTSPNTDQGAAYVFTRSAGVWTEQQKLLASDAESNEYFGISVALSSDGNTALIGAYEEDTSPSTANGAVYVFTRSGTTWTQQQKLLASDVASNDTFGQSVALSADGLTAIIGADLEDTSPNANNGAAYVFTLSAGVWSQQQKLTASDAAGSEEFGTEVSISSDGNTVIIGAAAEDTTPNSNNGAAYIFTRSGSTWTQQQKLTASDAESTDYFGQSVSISADGLTAIVGAYVEDTSPNTGNGAAYVFTLSAGVWSQQQKLTASDAATDDWFGVGVSLSSDGNTALIGANNEDTSPNTGNGAVYVFTRSGSTWTQQHKFLASDPGSGDSFGVSVALSSDGLTALIGAYSEDTSPNAGNGAAYIYNFNNIGTRYIYNSTDNRWEVDTFVPKKAPTTHLFTSSVASWTIPTGARIVHAVCIGGGGGGGGGGNNTPGGGGGSGGAMSIFTYNLITGYKTTAVITVGAGGAGGSGGGTNFLAEYVLGTAGATGGTSSFKLADSGNAGTLSAYGGGGGDTAVEAGQTSSTGYYDAGEAFGMWIGSRGGLGNGTPSYNGTSGQSASLESSPGAGGGGGGNNFSGTTGNGGAGTSASTFGVASGTAISKTDANIATLGTNSPTQFVNTYYPAKTPPCVVGPGGGGNGAPSGGYMVNTAVALGYNGGTGGLYGGGGGGGGSTPDGSGDESFGGNGGAGAQGCVFLTVWYE